MTIMFVVYVNSAVLSHSRYLQRGELSISIPSTSIHKPNETTKDESKQTVINYMSKWPPVVSGHIGATVYSRDNTTTVPSQNNNVIKVKPASQIVSVLTKTRPMIHVGGKKKIIVLTTMRSGSSFIGRILHEHPDIFYLFEPLQIIKRRNQILDNNDMLNSFLQKLFSCSFTYALHDGNVLPAHKPYRTFIKALPGHGHYLPFQHCTTFLRYIGNRASGKCRLTDIERIEVMCRQARYVAMKTISVVPSQLALIKKYLKEEVQIIHLNRDPRGVISSRIVLANGVANRMRKRNQKLNEYIIQNFPKLIEKASNHCKRIRDTNSRLALWTAVEPSLSQFYHLIRYEDFAYHPEAMTETLYSNIGLELDRHVLTWLRTATTTTATTAQKPGYWFSTTRNSTATAEAWRNKLPFHFVRAMQELPDCQFVMRRLGYEFAETETMLLNRSVSLVLKTFPQVH